MLKLAVLGATGGTGGAVVRRALACGHSVVALARNMEKLAASFGDLHIPARLTATKGDATSDADIERLLVDHAPDAIILAVGTNSLEKNTICFDTGVATVRAACRVFYTHRIGSPARVIAVSGGGLGAKPGLLMEKIIVPVLLKEPMIDALQMEAALRAAPTEAVEVTVIRPYRLTDGAATDHWRVVEEDFRAPLVIRYTTRADVAQSVVAEAETGAHRRRIVNVYTGGA